MDFFNLLMSRVEHGTQRIVFPEGEDVRVVQAAETIVKAGIAKPILLGKPEAIGETARSEGVDLAGVEVLDPAASEKLEAYVELLCAKRSLPEVAAKVMIKKPLYYAVMMLEAGDAAGMVSGCVMETSEVTAAMNLICGLEEGISTPSLFYVMDIPGYTSEEGSLLIMTDPAYTIDPTSEQLADIAQNAAAGARELLGWEPRVAMLSFSTKGSAEHAFIAKVTDAVEILHRRDPQLLVDGEFQLDAAINPVVAAQKLHGASEVAGRANVLVFPGIEAANIGVKIMQQLAGATGYTFWKGFAKPMCDISRSSVPGDIVTACLGVALQAQTRT